MLCSQIFFFTLIAFIVFYFKKRNARKKAGENYKSDERYLAVSKKKKIIGWICILSFVGIIITPHSAPKEVNDKPVATQVSQEDAEQEKAKKEKAEAERKEKERKAQEEAKKKYEEGLNLDLGINRHEFDKKYKEFDKGIFNTYKFKQSTEYENSAYLITYSCMSEDEVILKQFVKKGGTITYLVFTCDFDAAGAYSTKAATKLITIIRAIHPDMDEAEATILYEKIGVKSLVKDKTEVIEGDVKYSATYKNDVLNVVIANKGYTGEIYK